MAFWMGACLWASRGHGTIMIFRGLRKSAVQCGKNIQEQSGQFSELVCPFAFGGDQGKWKYQEHGRGAVLAPS